MPKYNRNIICIATIIFLISFVSAIITKYSLPNEAEYIIEITDKTYLKKLDEKEKFILFLYADSCRFCAKYEPILNKVLKETNIYAYKLQCDKNDSYLKILKEKLNERYQGTPAIYFYINGQVEEYLVGTQDANILKNYLNMYKSNYFK